MDTDLFVRDCRVVKPDGVVDCGLAIRGGSIAAVLRPGETVRARRAIDAGGRFVVPGLLDTHLHLGNAAQAFASDCATESRHAVTGGVTTLMPFVITRGSYLEALGEMRRAVAEQSAVDMLFHAIIVRAAQIDEIPRMASEFGVRSFKAFMAYKAWGPGRVATESCPHYLALDKDTDRGVQGKVNPPLRGRDHIDALWQRLTDGTVDVMGSDHCPYTKAVKGDELWAARAGITAGSAMILPVLLTEGVNRGRLTMPDVVRLTSYNAAPLFGLYPKKGALEAGADADLVIVDTDREVKVDLPAFHSAVDFSPYEGYVARGWAGTTIAGGRIAYDAGEVFSDGARGRYLARS